VIVGVAVGAVKPDMMSGSGCGRSIDGACGASLGTVNGAVDFVSSDFPPTDPSGTSFVTMDCASGKYAALSCSRFAALSECKFDCPVALLTCTASSELLDGDLLSASPPLVDCSVCSLLNGSNVSRLTVSGDWKCVYDCDRCT
jgi:hypothetical protein